jgi:Flp pilus assembly protein TadD
LIAARQWETARRVLEYLAKARPDDASIQARLAICLSNVEGPEAALPHITKAKQLEPSNAYIARLCANIERAARRERETTG